jgi:uncharacterized membrane protein HdeD (DUF308 family)
MLKIIGIFFVVMGVIMFINGVKAFSGNLKMKENDRSIRFNVGVKGIVGGLVAILIGVVIYFSY